MAMNLRRFFLPCGALVLCAAFPIIAATATQQKPVSTFVIKGFCTVQAQAYVDKAYAASSSSRFRMVLVQDSRSVYPCDFTIGEDPAYHYTALHGGVSPVPYGTRKQTTLQAVLHKYDILEERVTFKNLELGAYTPDPSRPHNPASRYLVLKEPVTITTPSGISVTLPTQGSDTLRSAAVLSGNADALFLRVETSPDQQEVTLPLSPLWRKHKTPVRIKIECAPPNSLVSYQADNTYKTLAVGLPNVKTAAHLDSLTLVIRQRVDVQSLPIALKVPVVRAASNRGGPKTTKKRHCGGCSVAYVRHAYRPLARVSNVTMSIVYRVERVGVGFGGLSMPHSVAW